MERMDEECMAKKVMIPMLKGIGVGVDQGWDGWCKAMSTLAGSARQANIVPITRSNTQGGKGSGGQERK